MAYHDMALAMPGLSSRNLPGTQSPQYTTDALLDELSRQLHGVQARRFSKGAHHQRPGSTMRISKPISASNSPRSSMIQARRRTLVNDGQVHPMRPVPTVDPNYIPSPASSVAYGVVADPVQRSSRPASWHPSSQQGAQPRQHQQLLQYPVPSYTESDFLATLRHLPPTPAIYSGYTSPASVFSPLALPYEGLEQQQYFSPPRWAVPTQLSHGLPVPQLAREDAQQFSSPANQSRDNPSESSLEWHSFVAHGFDRCTAPPTPEDFVQAAQPEPKLQSEESIPYQPLEEVEAEGEILYGMGLYDAPEKSVVDSQLDYHRSTISSLLGSPYKEAEPTGKGLKLEDAWEPPASDDEDDSQEDDAEGEDQEEEE